MNLVKGVIMKTIGELVGIDSEYQDSIEIVYDPTEIAEVTRRAIELHRETRKPRYTAKELWKKMLRHETKIYNKLKRGEKVPGLRL